MLIVSTFFVWKMEAFMNEIKSNFFSKFQKHIQEAEKSFQKEAYSLQDEVQKLNKIYQKKLVQIDKLYGDEEKKHNAHLKALQSSYQMDTKKLTENAIEKTKAKEKKVIELKQKWQDQQKTIEATFESKLNDKKKDLENTEKIRIDTEKKILKEYKESKKRLNKIKIQTAEVVSQAQAPFLNSLRYYMNRLKNGAAEDQKYFRQELSSIKKEMKKISTKEQKYEQSLASKIDTSKETSSASLIDTSKKIKSLNIKTKTFLTQTKKRYNQSFETFNESFVSLKKEIKRMMSGIEKRIEKNAETALMFQEQFENTPLKLEQTSLSEIKETEQRNHQTLVTLYGELKEWLNTLNDYTQSLNQSMSERYQSFIKMQDKYLETIIIENELLSQQLTQYSASKDLKHLISVDAYKDTFIQIYESLSQLLLDFQKQWHTTLYKVYKEAQEYYEELDDIQNFYDGFNEEKAIAFENENLHVTKKSAQLNIEIETAKKAYEVETLEADQNILFEKKNNAFLDKIYDSEIQLEKTRLNNAYRSKELEVMQAIKKASSDFKLKERFFSIEKDLLNDKKNYQIAVKNESFGIQKLELIKQLAIEKNDLVLSQEAELEQHKVSIVAAKTNLSKVKEDKRQYGLDLENKYQNKRNQSIFNLQKQIDENQVELKRLNFEEEREIRDIKQVLNDESLVARNRLKQFDSALKNRLQSINKPYKSSLKRLDRFYQLLDDQTTSPDEMVSVVSNDFKRELILSVESFYDTLKWTREYYSDLEIAKIKRSSSMPKKQTSDIEKHETSENRYKESLMTYLNVSKTKIEDGFKYFDGKIKNQSYKQSKEFTRGVKTFLDELLSLLEEQADSTTNEVIYLFEYIKEQDLAFIEEIEYGAETALNEIKLRYESLRNPFDQQISSFKEQIKTIKSSPLIVPDESENNHINEHESLIQQAEAQLAALVQETYQKEERFKADALALELEFDRKQENVEHERVLALQRLESEFDQEKERIESKINQAKYHFENIEASETQKLIQAKQTLDYGVQALTRKYDMMRLKNEERLEKITREQNIKKVEAERKLSTTIDDIQKEISSKELQLEAASEKVIREYETKYFEKQTRAQTLYERLDQLQKNLFYRKDSLLNELTLNLEKASSTLAGTFSSEILKKDVIAKLEAHQNYIDTFIDSKKNAFKQSL